MTKSTITSDKYSCWRFFNSLMKSFFVLLFFVCIIKISTESKHNNQDINYKIKIAQCRRYEFYRHFSTYHIRKDD